MKVAVHQPNYAPWNGYFAKMLLSDVFIFLDDVQFSRGSYTSRARVAHGRDADHWLTVPVVKVTSQLISDVRIADSEFATKHLGSLRRTYARAPYSDDVLDLIAPAYEQAGDSLAAFNADLIQRVARYLGWNGRFVFSSSHPSDLRADSRLADLVALVGGGTYISGAGGENYQLARTYRDRGVELDVRQYSPIPYGRSKSDWVPGLSVLDALFHQGPSAHSFMRYLRD